MNGVHELKQTNLFVGRNLCGNKLLNIVGAHILAVFEHDESFG